MISTFCIHFAVWTGTNMFCHLTVCMSCNFFFISIQLNGCIFIWRCFTLDLSLVPIDSMCSLHKRCMSSNRIAFRELNRYLGLFISSFSFRSLLSVQPSTKGKIVSRKHHKSSYQNVPSLASSENDVKQTKRSSITILKANTNENAFTLDKINETNHGTSERDEMWNENNKTKILSLLIYF